MKGNKIAILGDMFELGAESELEHAAVGIQTLGLALEQVIFCGENMKAAAATNLDALYFETKQALNDYLGTQTWEGKIILLKGSRGMGLESLLDYL